jgi:hypothetical protein
MAITTRETTATGVTNKGAPLTNAEVDTNFIELVQTKVDVSGAIIFAAKAGEALSKGDVVYVSGVSGNSPVVSKADANVSSKMPAYGLAETDANNNAAVNIVTFGTLYELDTSAFSVGDTVYVSQTAGAITATKPAGESSLIQNVGKVIRPHASAGSIKVGGAGRTNDTPNLDDGNVFIGNGSNQAVARALTGDDVSGGTITSFASTGIDDNATSNAITIDASQNTAFSGDITLTGTVDGRDVATDGTKLDGIEASADVTDTANVTTAGALMDSEVTNLAQVKAFDSSDYATAAQGTTADSALQNVVEDTTPQLGGNLDFNGNLATSFTSTGIDDNATSTAVTIDQNQNTVFSGSLTATTGLFSSTLVSQGTIKSSSFKRVDNNSGFDIDASGIITFNNQVEISTSLHVKATESSTGETDPIARFERFTTGDNAYLDITVNNSTNMIGFQSTGTSDGGFTFGGASTDLVTISNNGNVDVSGTLHASYFSFGNTNSLLYESADDFVNIRIGASGPYMAFEKLTATDVAFGNASGALDIVTSGGAAISIDTSRNVGIGGDGNAKLEVFGPLASPALGTYNNSAAIISNIAGGYGMSFSVDGTGAGYIQAQNFTSAAAYNLVLQSAGGNVGIGTTTVGQFGGVDVGLTVDGGGAYSGIAVTDGATTGSLTQGYSTTYLYNQANGNMLFGTNNTERMRIAADGTFEFKNGIQEQQYSLTGTAINPNNGTIQYKTLGANTTFTESLSNGEFVTLMINDGSGFIVTWPTTTWIGGSAPVLQTLGYNVIELWRVNGTLYGAFVGTA